MVGILLLTHAPLGQAFIAAATHVFRAQPERLEAIDVMPDQDRDEVNALAQAAIGRLDEGSGVLVMTDVMGGTPSNCCTQLSNLSQVEVIAGISLPMLLRAITYRREAVDIVAEMAIAGGQSGAIRMEHKIHLPDS